MTGNQILAAYTEIVKNDLFPVLALNASGVDSAMALHYLNIGAERVMRSLRRQAKATFSFSVGTQSYNIQSCTSERFFEISKVNVDDRTLARIALDNENDEGYTVIGDTLTFSVPYASAFTISLWGYVYGASVAATDTDITDIPSALHLAVAQLAVVESCGSHDISPEQQQKLMNLQRIAEDAITRQSQRDGMNTFPSDLVNGRK